MRLVEIGERLAQSLGVKKAADERRKNNNEASRLHDGWYTKSK